jgi:monothiol glutaredoxin
MSDSPFNILNNEEKKNSGEAVNDSMDCATEVSPKDRIEKLISQNKVFCFVKGNPEAPQCGFSYNTMEIFNQLGVNYKTFDVLMDPTIRQGIKDFTNWPTIPQVFINGEFVGGNDILTSLYQSGELQDMVKDL